MTKYQIHSTGVVHELEAATYVQDSNGLRFIGTDGVTLAIYSQFDWMRIAPVVAEPVV